MCSSKTIIQSISIYLFCKISRSLCGGVKACRYFSTMYDDVTLCMMMWHYVWWCDTMYDDVTLCMMIWHYVWWCDTMYDDVTLCLVKTCRHLSEHYVWWCDTMYDDVTLCMMMWHCVWWCDTVYDDVTLCMMNLQACSIECVLYR